MSKVELPAIHTCVVSHLLNIHADLAQQVADGLGLKQMPAPAKAAIATRTDLKPSDALSILKNGPQNFKGRKLGILVTDSVDIKLYNAFTKAVQAEGASFEAIAPTIGGVDASDGTHIDAMQKVNGGSSVLYDAVVLLLSQSGAELLAQEATARDFISDAFAHCKFIGYTQPALALFDKSGLRGNLDAGCMSLDSATDAKKFLKTCDALRFWERENKVSVV